MIEVMLFPDKSRWFSKRPVCYVVYGNLNFRQAISQPHRNYQRWQSVLTHSLSLFVTLCRIIHHAALEFNPCLNKSLPQLVRFRD